MSLRDSLEKKPGLGIGVGLALASVAAVAIYVQVRSDRPPTHSAQAFFSDDDGATYFADSFYKLPPFDHNGRPAVRAYVFATPSGQKFVGFLQRFKPDVLKTMRDEYAKVEQGTATKVQFDVKMQSPDMVRSGMEDKLPGPDHQWMAAGGFQSSMIKPPGGGGAGPLQAVTP